MTGLIACSNLGLLVEKQEPVRARALFERACDDGERIGCTNLGHILLGGAGVVMKDPPRARDVLEKACSAGDDLGCHNLAIVLDWGLGGPRDARRARKLRAR